MKEKIDIHKTARIIGEQMNKYMHSKARDEFIKEEREKIHEYNPCTDPIHLEKTLINLEESPLIEESKQKVLKRNTIHIAKKN